MVSKTINGGFIRFEADSVRELAEYLEKYFPRLDQEIVKKSIKSDDFKNKKFYILKK